MDELYYLSIDPGQQNTGYAMFKEDGSDITFGTVKGGLDGFVDWLEELDPKPKEIIYENYRVSPTVSHTFSKVPTIQVIGALKGYARRHKMPLHEMSNINLKVALKMVGCYNMYYDATGKKTKHVDDQISAYAHGVYFLIKNKVRKSRLDRT